MTNKTYEYFSAERKRLQSLDLAPTWMTTAGYQLLVDKHYLQKGETPLDMYRRVSGRAGELVPESVDISLFNDDTGIDNWSELFFQDMWNGWLSPSTTVLTNLGTEKGHPVSCSGTYLDDSIDGFYRARHEIAMLTKLGYGTSWDLSNVRARGSIFGQDGVASGVTQPMEGVRQDMRDVSQGSTRRGSVGQYLDVLHRDFDEVNEELRADDAGLNIGWIFTNEYKELAKSNPTRADEIWKKVLKTKMQTGKGYLFWKDKVNARRPQMYVDRGFSVAASNLCVAGDTKILTRDGYVEIHKLAGQTVECWNGEEWSMTPLFKTGETSDTSKVTLSSGLSITATNYHKWYRAKQDSRGKLLGYDEVRTHELVVGDKLIKFDLEPVTHGTKELEHAYSNGFHTGDGTVVRGLARITLYSERKKQLKKIITGYTSESETKSTNKAGGTKVNLWFKNGILKDKFFIPSNEYSVKSRLEWLAGLFDADGTLTNNKGSEGIQLVSTDTTFLKELYLMLQELGVQAKIKNTKEAGYCRLPSNDGIGGYKDYWCKALHRVTIPGSELIKLVALGYRGYRVKPTGVSQNREAKRFLKVTAIEPLDEVIETFCGTEPKRNKLMFNGQLTGNCLEIHLFSDKDHTFSCVLSTVNAYRWDEWKGTKLVQRSMVFLDSVNEDMLEKAKKDTSGTLERIIRFAEKTRAVGLGVQGNTSYMQQNRMIYGDMESRQYEFSLFKHLDEESLKASKYLAEVVGEPEYMVGYGERFSHRLTLPPTMSTSVIMGGYNEGCMPVYANVFTQDTAGGNVFRINPVFLELMKEREMYTEQVMQRIVEANGSVQEEDWLTDHEKKVFLTAFEVNQYTVLSMASERNKRVDQGQSINLCIDDSTTEEEISDLHLYAENDPFIFGLYYIRSLNGLAKHKSNDECVACQG